MVSNTQKTQRIRARRLKNQGKRRKRHTRLNSTPSFPVHPAGYDQGAPDAKPVNKG